MNKPEILIMKTKELESYILSKHLKSSVIISIYDEISNADLETRLDKSEDSRVKQKANFYFSDNNTNSITDSQASDIAEFVRKHTSSKDNLVDRIIVSSPSGYSRASGIAAAITEYLFGNAEDILTDKRYKPNTLCYNKIIRRLLSQPLSFYEAWHYLENHPIFCGHFQDCYDLEVVKVNPANEVSEDNEELNTQTQVWLECGPYDPECRTHNIDLDCGGDTFEDAIIALALLVQQQYGDNI